MTGTLDHIVWAVPDLAAGVARFAELTGVEAPPGGRHQGVGTANHLVRLTGPVGGGGYLEIIGPDPGQPDPEVPRPFGIDALREQAIATWAVRVTDLSAALRAAREAGYDPGDVHEMSRATPDGELLEWRLTVSPDNADGILPFLIDWGGTPHPATRPIPSLDLVSWSASHPDPRRIERAAAALGVALTVREGAPALVAEIAGPRGSVILR